MLTDLEIKKRLLKKWKWIKTRYEKLRDNNWIKKTKKFNTTTILDCNLTKDYYLKQIENAEKIINNFTKDVK